jgi:hypothetical protein
MRHNLDNIGSQTKLTDELLFYAPGVIEDPGASSVLSVCLSVCVCVSVRPDHKVKVFSSGPKLNSFHYRPSILGKYLHHVTPITCARPHHPNSRSRSFAGLWLKFFCSQVKVYISSGMQML